MKRWLIACSTDRRGALLGEWEDAPELGAVWPGDLLRNGRMVFVISPFFGPDLTEHPGRHIRILEFELPEAVENP